ncbi:hypothetical protein WL1483_1933 [Aeromonas schubertii]|uniref:Uncharacterized protein n=1 Tax=Aeromonas schubertii TaxID=652 RepID=A0A0S2SI12_9GAMM|nr:hypothetical protein WL1483_1933 [Aeromonas schubertii]
MAGRGLAMAIYVVRVATRAVNGDGCHEAMSLKGTHHISSTDRRHYQRVFVNAEQVTTLISLRDTLLPKLISGELSLDDIELTTQQGAA